MPESLIARTSTAEGLHRLGLHGQPVVVAHKQLATILTNRLGPEHGAFLSRPQIDPATGAIDWYARAKGPIRRVSELPDSEQSRVRARAEQIRQQIQQLAIQLQSEGQAAELVGKMLEQALQSPAGDWLYSVGGEPMLVMWGHGTAASAPAAVAAAPTAASPGFAAAQATPQVSAVGLDRRWWWLLGTLLLTLIVALALRQCEQRAIPLTEPIAHRELPPTPPPTPQPPVPSTGLNPAQTPEASPSAEPLVEPKIEPQRSPAPPQQKKAQPPPADIGKALEIPEEAARTGRTDFLEGEWKVGDGLKIEFGRSSRAIDVFIRFGPDGNGEMIARYKDTGALCRAPARGKLRGPQLSVTVPEQLRCQDGTGAPSQQIECTRMSDGRTRCQGVNIQMEPQISLEPPYVKVVPRRGHAYAMDIVRTRKGGSDHYRVP